MIRTFLSIELPEALRANLSQLQADLKRRVSPDFPRKVRITWVQPASIHLTIKFLGDIDEQLVVPMKEALDEAVRDHHTLMIPLVRLGVFPRIQQPRTLWVGPSEEWERGEESRRLASLHRALDDCCYALNLARDERPFTPHLTLARIKEGERSVGQALTKSGVIDRSLDVGSVPVASILLMRSQLRPTGPVYSKLWEAPLREGT